MGATNNWTTKTGQVIKIKNLTDSHLINCIKMMQRKIPVYKEMLIEQTLRPMEASQVYDLLYEDYVLEFDSMTDDNFLLKCVPTYVKLIEEKNKRGI